MSNGHVEQQSGPSPASTYWVPVGGGPYPATTGQQSKILTVTTDGAAPTWAAPAPSGANITYKGAYDPAATYHDGDIVLDANGISYQCVIEGTHAIAPVPWSSGMWGVPQPVVNGQWLKGIGGAAVWSPIIETDVRGLQVADTAWHVVGTAGEPAYKNGYSSWDGLGATARAPRFRRLSSGLVLVDGIFATPTPFPPSPNVAFTLPAGYRTNQSRGDITFIVNASTGPCIANLNTTGDIAITPVGGGAVPTQTWVYIDGIQFFAEA